MAAKISFINGITEYIILSVLEKHDSYVYEIVKMISDYSGGKLSISQNTIYTATYKLENEGKISEYSKLVGRKRTRVYYKIEPEGLEYLKELSETYEAVTSGVHSILTKLNSE